MEPLAIFIGITILFFLILILKKIFNLKKICTICTSITISWITLLTFYLSGIFHGKTIIAILMGHTSLGMFYIFERKAKENLKVFRLPLLLSFIFVIYSILESFNLKSLIFIGALWFFFFIIYLLKTTKIKSLFNQILECCKKW